MDAGSSPGAPPPLRARRPAGRPSPAMAVAMAALFISLSGSALALNGTGRIDHNDLRAHVVHAGNLHNQAVRTAKLAPRAVNTSRIAPRAVRRGRIATGAVSFPQLDPGAFRAGDIEADPSGSELEIPTDAIGSGEIADGSVRSPDLGATRRHVGATTTVNDPGGHDGQWTGGTATATCAPGEQLIGGSAQWTTEGPDDPLVIGEVVPIPADDEVFARGLSDDGPLNHEFRAIALCLDG